MLVDFDGTEDADEIAEAIVDAIDDEDEIVKIITELYFLLNTPERVQVKRNIG